jgi:hypothetical protein
MITIAVMTVAWWLVLFAACALLRRFIGPRWRRVGVLAIIPAALIATALEFFNPPIGAYEPMVARYWMSRAAEEPDAAKKEAYVRRVAFKAPEYGWFIASQAIDHVEQPVQRCRLRTILAALPGIRNQQKLGGEARDACNATLLERRP